MHKNNLPRWYDENSNKMYLVLHDDCIAVRLANDSENYPKFYQKVVQARRIFQRRTRVRLYIQGRRVCIDDTTENSRRYQRLKRIALDLEAWVAKDFASVVNQLTTSTTGV